MAEPADAEPGSLQKPTIFYHKQAAKGSEFAKNISLPQHCDKDCAIPLKFACFCVRGRAFRRKHGINDILWETTSL